MRVVVPFAAKKPKTRLRSVLDTDERNQFAHVMLQDVLSIIQAAGHDPEVLATAAVDTEVPVVVDDRPLTDAVNNVLEATSDPVAIIMADLPLMTVESVDRLFSADGDVVIAPGRGGGTNALVVRETDFRVDYHGVSYLDHTEAVRDLGVTVNVVDSHRLATDVDEPADLLETFLHAEGKASSWLADVGFQIVTSGGRPRLERGPAPPD